MGTSSSQGIAFTSSLTQKAQDAAYQILTDLAAAGTRTITNNSTYSVYYYLIYRVESVKVDGAPWSHLSGSFAGPSFVNAADGKTYGYTVRLAAPGSTVTLGPDPLYSVDMNYVPHGSHAVELKLSVIFYPAPNTPAPNNLITTSTVLYPVVLADTIYAGAPPATCELGISSVPGGAEIFLNGQSTGKITPASGYVTWTLSPGIYRLVLKKAGYVDAADLLTLTADKSTAKNYTLAVIPPVVGYLKVTSSPANLQIKLDNSVSQNYTPYTFTLPAGRYFTSVKFSGVWASDKVSDVIVGRETVIPFDFSQGGVTKEQLLNIFTNAILASSIEPCLPLLMWYQTGDPTGFSWMMSQLPLELHAKAVMLGVAVAGAEFLVLACGGAIIAAGASAFSALCDRIGGAAANALLEALNAIPALASSLSSLMEGVGTGAMLKGGISLGTIQALTKGTVIAMGWIAAIIGTSNFIAWADKEAVIESYTFNIQALMTAERYEDALARINQNRLAYQTAVSSLNTFGTVGIIAKGMWQDAAAGYLQRWTDLETTCKQKLAEIPEGVGVGQSKIILKVDPSPFEIKWTHDTKTTTSPYEKIVLQGKYDIVLDAQGFAPQTISVNMYQRKAYTSDVILVRAPEEPLPDEALVNVRTLDASTKASINTWLYIDNVKYTYHASSFTFTLKAGAHNLRAEEEYYVTKSVDVAIVAGKEESVDIELTPFVKPKPGEPGSEFGKMIVNIYDSVLMTPKSAYLDVDYQRQASHLASYSVDLTAVSHLFTVEETGYVKKEVTESISAGETKTLNIYIVKEAAPPAITTGTLNVSIFRSDTGAAETAYLYINDVQQPGHESTYSLTLEQGGYSIKASELGFSDEVVTANVNAGLTTNRSISLTPTEEVPPTKGVVSVTTVPSGARIYINGILQPYLSPQRYDLDAGTYVFKITKEGYEDKSDTFAVEAGKQYAKTYVLTAVTTTPAQTAWKVNVISTPSGGKILIDGDVTGKYTPDYLILNPGTYIIRVEKTGYYPAEKSITLEAF